MILSGLEIKRKLNAEIFIEPFYEKQLNPNIEICQIYYHSVEGNFTVYNSGKYQNNQGIQPSLLFKDFLKN
jgi:deoxycytidine triphosphate deaminase